ncbi:MAG: DUF1566 domain-containing protein [Magnetococcales bacterium]|nr:DUF1566 domain-containing protein [Magnetococcales bacterium]
MIFAESGIYTLLIFFTETRNLSHNSQHKPVHLLQHDVMPDGGVERMNPLLWLCFFFPVMSAFAGSLTAPAAPTDAGSAMYSLEDLYQRLDSGAPGTKRTGTLPEPTAGPAATGHSLDDIMSKAPVPDNINGATASDVTCGRIFWGLRTDGTWGQQTGGTPGCTPPTFNSTAIARTGQTTSYAAGDDGILQTGVVWPDPRFVDNGDGTITDNLTGLVWMKRVDCWSPQIWYDALAKVNGLNTGEETCTGYTTGTHTDWRLPNREELISLIDYGRFNPALPICHPFLGIKTESSRYWTSTFCAKPFPEYIGDRAWDVNLSSGVVMKSSIVKPSSSLKVYNSVWPVRGGQ